MGEHRYSVRKASMSWVLVWQGQWGLINGIQWRRRQTGDNLGGCHPSPIFVLRDVSLSSFICHHCEDTTAWALASDAMLHLLFIKMDSLFGQLCSKLPNAVPVSLSNFSHSQQINFVSIESQWVWTWALCLLRPACLSACSNCRAKSVSVYLSVCLILCLSLFVFLLHLLLWTRSVPCPFLLQPFSEFANSILPNWIYIASSTFCMPSLLKMWPLCEWMRLHANDRYVHQSRLLERKCACSPGHISNQMTICKLISSI